ncbi:MAG: LysR family transcriptional regulator [Proteobacteria bacterium]|nr:LysR family transcriptional regulator [Pseudomonadota bacterium]
MFLKCNPNDLYLFAVLVEAGGYTAAAKALSIPKSRLSRRISALEETLEARLLQRSTRAIHLTEAGHALYQHSRAMIEAAHAGEDAVRDKHGSPTGLVRVSVPLAVGHVIVSHVLARFLEDYPEVRVEVNVSNRNVDLIAEGYDLAVRGIEGSADDSALVQVSLCKLDWIFVASPRFVDTYGLPQNPQDLSPNQMLLYSKHQVAPNRATITSTGGETVSIPLNPRMTSNSFLMLKAGALGGFGVAGLPPYMCRAELETGTLVHVMSGWVPRPGEIVAMFPTRRGLAPATRVLLEYLKRELPAAAQMPLI